MNNQELKTFLTEIENTQPNFTYESAPITKGVEEQAQIGSDIGIKTLSGIGGFLSSILFVGLLFALDFIDGGGQFIVFGIGFTALAVWANIYFDNLIFDTASISLYMIGVSLIIYGINEFDNGDNLTLNITSLALLIIAGVTIYFSKAKPLLFLACSMVIAGLAIPIFNYEVYNFAHFLLIIEVVALTYLLLNEGEIIKISTKVNFLFVPLRSSLIISIIATMIAMSFEGKDSEVYFNQLSSITFLAATIYTIYKIIGTYPLISKNQQVLIYIVTTVLFIPAMFHLPIAGALFLLVITFYTDYITGLAMSIGAIIFATVHYFATLELSLLLKSIMMIVSGIFFILAYFGVIKLIQDNKG